MRPTAIIATAFVLLSVFASTEARAIEYPWCARFGGDMEGASNCGFTSFEQCLAYLRGIGGFCEPNLFYTGPAAKPARRVYKRHRRRTPSH
jgi:hypothetical protein